MKAKKLLFAALLVLLLLLVMAPAAFADSIYPAPGPMEAGSSFNHLLATVAANTSVSAEGNTLPYGVDLAVEPNGEEWNVYLRGMPMVAGSYDCILYLGETSTICHLDISPATPVVSSSESVVCYLNDPVSLSVSAWSADGSTLSYQWYYSQFGQSENGSVIGGAVDSSLGIGTAYVGTSYYYCVVTNTNNGLIAQTVSPVIAVTVEENSAQTLSLVSYPQKLLYRVGEMLDTTGMQLAVSYANGTTELVTEGFQCQPLELTVAGSQTITVSFRDMSCSFDVAVEEQAELVTGIGILTYPNKLRYTVGEMLNTTGLSIRAYTNLGNYRDVDNGFICTPTSLSFPGEQEITVSYGDAICSFTVTVDAAEVPVSLAVSQPPTRTTYRQGDYLDITGLVLRQISSLNNRQEIYSGFSCSPIQLNTVGYQQITVYYGELTTTFTVTVTEASQAVAPTLAPSYSAVTPVPTLTPAYTAPTPVPTQAPSYAEPVSTTAPSSVSPTAAPAPESAATPLPTTVPMPVPTVSAAPTVRPGSHSSHQSNLGRSLISIIVITAVMALAILGAYVFVMNQGGFEGAARTLKELFRGGKRRRK